MRRLAASLAAALALGLAGAPAAAAQFGFEDLGIALRDTEPGTPQAGGHPLAFETTIAMRTTLDGSGDEVPIGETRELTIELPDGFAGEPTAAPRCSTADFVARAPGEGRPLCPNSTVVGRTASKLEFNPIPPHFGDEVFVHDPVYNLNPAPGSAAKLGFVVRSVPVTIDVGIAQSYPHNVVATVRGIPQAVLFYASETILWGNPSASVHDPLRGSCLDLIAAKVNDPPSRGSCPVDALPRPYLTSPRSCTGPLEARFRALAWNTGAQDAGSASTEAMGECAKLIPGFAPKLSTAPTTDAASGPSGLFAHLEIDDPGLTNPNGIAGSDIKQAVVTLPAGMTINPSQAEGLGVCSEAQLAQERSDSPFGAGCPGASKIGTVEVRTPLLEEILEGSVFVAEPYNNRFGSLLAIYVAIKSAKHGINVILAGKVEPDPATGQLTTTFGGPGTDPLPQLPFSDFRLRFREGGRSPLITPPACGSYEVKAVFTPWANPATTHTETSTFQISRGVGGGPCPPPGAPPHEPGFSAGTVNNNAASHSPFAMRLTRRDGDQDLVRFDAALPKGLLAKLAGVAQCSDAQIAAIAGKSGLQERAAPSCPPNSRIGGVWAGAGVGSQLTYVPGSIYLAGPFGGAPLSVVAIVPAVAGPFDVGVVATRQALTLDPVTAEVKVDGTLSQPIPHMLAGIPLKVRDIQVNVDRPQFTLNPTSCNEMVVGASIWGGGANPFTIADDFAVPRGARFQAANCARLGFKPRLGFRLKGGTRRGDHPAVRAVLTPRRGDANLRRTVVRFPRATFLDQSNIRTVCTRVQWAAKACPKGSIYGRVRAWTPLLDFPLQGPVYLRSSTNKLPDLAFDLKGIVDIETAARVDSVKGTLRVTFPAIPDAPVSRVLVDMRGGKRGLIVNSRNLCAKPRPRANVRLVGHNSRAQSLRPVLRAVRCGKDKARKGAQRMALSSKPLAGR